MISNSRHFIGRKGDVEGRQEVHWRDSLGQDNYRDAINLLFPANQLLNPPSHPANLAVQPARTMAGCMCPCLLCCVNLCHSFVAWSSEGRGRQREKQDSPGSIMEVSLWPWSLSYWVGAVFHPFSTSPLRQFFFQVSLKEHTRPRLTLLQHTLYATKNWTHTLQAPAIKVLHENMKWRAIWPFYLLTSQLLIKMRFSSFSCSCFPTLGIVTSVLSTVNQEGDEVRLDAFYKRRGMFLL